MTFKKTCQIATLISGLAMSLIGHAEVPLPSEYTIQINTDLKSMIGHPEWLLIIRDKTSQRVLPYLFDFRKKINMWVAFATSQAYTVTTSKLTWGPYAVIDNFCHLENQDFIGHSLLIRLNKNLSPDPTSFKCNVEKI